MDLLEKLKNDPQNPNLYREYGIQLLKENRGDEALEVFSTGLVYNPFDYVMRFWRGRKYIGREMYVQSASDLKLAAMTNPEDWECWYYLGVACYLAGLYEEAKAAHERSRTNMIKYGIKAVPATVDWYWMICMKLGQKEEAQAVLDYVYPGMETEDGDYLARTLLYKGYYKPENFVEERMKEIQNPERPRIYEQMLTFGLANYLHYQGRDEEAVPLFKSLAESPDNRSLFAVKQAMEQLTELGIAYTVPKA
ncbi:MAG: hypothetical protein Q4C61_01060 [Lachnospiraceae bacterium]|nr:hypothetical protein [Lachnospiraceae bacterium]